jgi:outer membrane protein
LQYLLVQIQNSIRQNILTLKQLLQLSTDTPFDIVTPAAVDVTASLPPLQEVQQAALNNFPEIEIGQLGRDIASTNILIAKAGFKPTLKANAALGTGYSDVLTNTVSNPAYPKTPYFTQTGRNFYQNLGFTLSIPVFSQRINKANLAKANIAYKQADLNLQNDQLVLLQAVELAYLSAVNAQQSYKAAEQQLVFATESYRIANEQLKLGAINTYDLLLQQNQYVQAVQAFNQAKYTAVLQHKIYEFYMGKPVVL